MSLDPFPSRERLPVSTEGRETFATIPRALIVWFANLQATLSPTGGSGILWSAISKLGSNLTDLSVRRHSDLQDLNSPTHTHLTALNATDLTDGGDTILHKHDHNLQDNLQGGATDEKYHLSNSHHTDLTDGGDATIHYHQSDRIHARNHALYRV